MTSFGRDVRTRTAHVRSIVRPRAMRVRPPTAVVALVLVIGLLAVAFPRSTMACSCLMVEQPMRAAAAQGGLSVFTGIAGPLEPIGVAVRITRWFRGDPPPNGVAVLDPAGFEDPMGGMCGTNAPDVGMEWIFVASRDDVGRYGVSMCTTHAPLASGQGQALLAEAITVFGPGGVPEPPATPTAPTASPAGDPAGLVSTVVPIAIAVLFATGLLAGLFVILGPRRSR